jgi:hypothetical protein
MTFFRSIIWNWREKIVILHRNYGKTSDNCNDSVAQLVEHNTFNVGVLGSSPSGITKKSTKLQNLN